MKLLARDKFVNWKRSSLDLINNKFDVQQNNLFFLLEFRICELYVPLNSQI